MNQSPTQPTVGYASYPSLVDRTVFVTSEADGIGRSIVHQFATQGSRVAFVDIHSWQDMTPEYRDNRISTNLRHYFFAIQATAPGMIEAGSGSIINIGSSC